MKRYSVHQCECRHELLERPSCPPSPPCRQAACENAASPATSHLARIRLNPRPFQELHMRAYTTFQGRAIWVQSSLKGARVFCEVFWTT